MVDYTASYSWSRFNRGTGKAGGNLISGITAIGWIVDRSQNELYPTITQTGGLDVTNPANYRPAGNSLTVRDQDDYEEVKGLTGNVRVQLFARQQLFAKAGIDWRGVDVDQINRDRCDRRYTYAGTTALPHDTSAQVRSRLNIPHWHPGMFVRNGVPVSPELWNQNAYFHEALRYTGRRFATETVTAGYGMLEARMGNEGLLSRTNFLTGVRMEKTETEGRGFVRARVLSSAAQQTADPVGSAARDYANNARTLRSDYTKSFPSIHLAHDFTPNWKGRVSWSTSFGRPNMNNMFPTETPNENGEFVTVNNHGLVPQTGRNWDANLDYYFKPAGYFSVGWFHKNIRDFLVPGVVVGNIADDPNNGFGVNTEGSS